MKKLFVFLTIAGMLTFGLSNAAFSVNPPQDGGNETEQGDSSQTVDTLAAPVDNAGIEDTEDVIPTTKKTFHQVLKEKFIEGNATFMTFPLLALILGLALCIERIIYLNMATSNTKKLLHKLEGTMETGGVSAAKELCKSTKGPVASIFFQGLDRVDEGIEVAEKSIVAYGAVLMGRLEKNLSWISLFIALAPMLGFMGTVIGMISAFDDIMKAGDISAVIVAEGIKVALLTTVFGLIVAIILQIFYNYIVSKIDSIVNDMEDSSITFIDILTKYQSK